MPNVVWITILEAATLAHRPPLTIRRWVKRELLQSQTDNTGTLRVLGHEVLQLEPTMPTGPGRPKKTACRLEPESHK